MTQASLSRSARPEASAAELPLLRYVDVLLVLLAAPMLLAIGVPAVGYGVGAATWIVLRAVGLAVDRHAGAIVQVRAQLTLRLGYRLARVFLLALATVLVRQGVGKDDGLTALLVITFAFTLQLTASLIHRPVSR